MYIMTCMYMYMHMYHLSHVPRLFLGGLVCMCVCVCVCGGGGGVCVCVCVCVCVGGGGGGVGGCGGVGVWGGVWGWVCGCVGVGVGVHMHFSCSNLECCSSSTCNMKEPVVTETAGQKTTEDVPVAQASATPPASDYRDKYKHLIGGLECAEKTAVKMEPNRAFGYGEHYIEENSIVYQGL